jgi:hypothetical protein
MLQRAVRSVEITWNLRNELMVAARGRSYTLSHFSHSKKVSSPISAPAMSSRKASASRALLESVPTSRRIPDCRFLTPLRKVRNDSGEELSSRGAPTSRVIPRSANLPCHPEERQPPMSSRGASATRDLQWRTQAEGGPKAKKTLQGIIAKL